MNNIIDKIRNIQPELAKRVGKGWLATSPVGESLRIGVIGITELNAREKFTAAIERWAEIFNTSTTK